MNRRWVATLTHGCLESGAFEREPCYRDDRRSSPSVLCVSDPWAHAAIGFDVPALPARRPPIQRPWALELASDVRCVAIELGATDVTTVAGRRLSYECTPLLGGQSRSSIRSLFGQPSRRTSTWRIRAARDERGRGMRTVAVRIAWR